MAERLLCKERVRSSSLLVSTNPSDGMRDRTTEELGSTRGDTKIHEARNDGPAIEPLIRALPPAGRPPTSGSLGTIDLVSIVGGPPRWAAPLQLDSVRQK